MDPYDHIPDLLEEDSLLGHSGEINYKHGGSVMSVDHAAPPSTGVLDCTNTLRNSECVSVRNKLDGRYSRCLTNRSDKTLGNDSYFSVRHLSLDQIRKRTSTIIFTVANIGKLFIGIAFLGVPQGYADVGIIGGTIGLLYILAINCFTTYLIVKARNKYRNTEI